MPSSPPSRAAYEAKYRDIRRAAIQVAQGIASAQFAPVPVRLDGITPSALAAFREQWEGYPRRNVWDWMQIAADAARNEPSRFEVSVWSGQSLCGLAVGATRNEFCRVDWMEGSPIPNHPLKGSVTLIVSGAATAYATALGRSELRLMNPIPAMIPRYQDLGFVLAEPQGGSPYCWWKIR